MTKRPVMQRRTLAAIAALAAGAAILMLAATPARAQADGDDAGSGKDDATIAEPRRFVTRHRGTFNGQALRYTATAGETYLRDKNGKPQASIFSFAYTRDDAGAERPVTFVWNGGPGSASLWLHMGTFGPQRVVVPSDAGHPGAPPFDVRPATETILDVTDLVFVDPVGTGFSRALGEREDKEYWGLGPDAQSMAEFIRTWVTEQGRWNSPRFLLGESYGTTRAAAVAELLEGEFMMSLNGIVFVSQALDYLGSTPYLRDNLVANVTFVPTMAATAWFHGRVSPRPADLETFLAEAREFCIEELLPALFRGNALDGATRARVRDGLARFTGLSPDYIERANLRIHAYRFAKELMRDEGRTVGLLDSRYTRDEIDDLEAAPDEDASDAISAAFNTALMSYMQGELGVDWDRLYLANGDPELPKEWRWRRVPDGEEWEPLPVNTAHDLSKALRRNPDLKVMVASGYYDLITPFFDAEYTLNRHDIDASRITYRYYGGGHMMYVNEPSRTRLLEDTRRFINEQLAR